MNSPQTTAAFVMPHFGDTLASGRDLLTAIASVQQQTDPDWHLLLIDDASPRAEDRNLLASLNDPRITILCNQQRSGPGPARNRAIEAARKRNAPFVLFLDSDDIATPDRLALTRAAFADPAVGVVYSLFEAIDSSGRPLDPALLAPSIQVILRALTETPPSGPRAWIEMATTFGYCNLTSTTAVRTGIAAAVPFPAELVSDDMHTWFRYGGFGAAYHCVPSVTCGYRIPDPALGSSCRRRFGQGFYAEKARVDSDGFEQAIEMALAGERLQEPETIAVRQAFRNRLARELAAEGEHRIATLLQRLPPDQIASADLFRLAGSVTS